MPVSEGSRDGHFCKSLSGAYQFRGCLPYPLKKQYENQCIYGIHPVES